MKNPERYLITGERGVGKTSFCREIVTLARANGWDIAGLLSPPVFSGQEKTGILAENLRTGATRPLACTRSTLEISSPAFTIPLGDWFFDPDIISWGNQILQTEFSCDLLIIDEIGPFELLRGEGWTNALSLLAQEEYQLALIVIRLELIKIAKEKLSPRGVITLNPADSPQEKAQIWWKRVGE